MTRPCLPNLKYSRVSCFMLSVVQCLFTSCRHDSGLERLRLGALRGIQRRPGPGFLFLAEEVTVYRHSPVTPVVLAICMAICAFDGLLRSRHVTAAAAPASCQVLTMPLSLWFLIQKSWPGLMRWELTRTRARDLVRSMRSGLARIDFAVAAVFQGTSSGATGGVSSSYVRHR